MRSNVLRCSLALSPVLARREKIPLDAPFVVTENGDSFLSPVLLVAWESRSKTDFLATSEAPTDALITAPLVVVDVDSLRKTEMREGAFWTTTLGLFPLDGRREAGVVSRSPGGLTMVADLPPAYGDDSSTFLLSPTEVWITGWRNQFEWPGESSPTREEYQSGSKRRQPPYSPHCGGG